MSTKSLKDLISHSLYNNAEGIYNKTSATDLYLTWNIQF